MPVCSQPRSPVSVLRTKVIYTCWIFKIDSENNMCLRPLTTMILLSNEIFVAFSSCKFLFFGRGQPLLILPTRREFLTLTLYLAKTRITSALCACWQGCLPACQKSDPQFWLHILMPWCRVLPDTKNQLSDSQTPTACSTIQFNSDRNYPELALTSKFKGSSHKTAPHSPTFRRQSQALGLLYFWLTDYKSTVPTTISSGLIIC